MTEEKKSQIVEVVKDRSTKAEKQGKQRNGKVEQGKHKAEKQEKQRSRGEEK